jgi:hypothetical protein
MSESEIDSLRADLGKLFKASIVPQSRSHFQ